MMKESLLQLLPPLLMQLEEIKAKNDRLSARCDSIGDEIPGIKEIFSMLEAWESSVRDKFGDIAKSLNDIFDNNNRGRSSDWSTVSSQVSGLKAYITPLSELLHSTDSRPSRTRSLPSPAGREIEDADVTTDIMQISDMPAISDDIPKAFLFVLFNLPQNAVIKKSLLIHWWIGGRGSDPAQCRAAAEAFFEELIKRKVIIPICRDHRSGTMPSCMLNPRAREESHAFGFRRGDQGIPLVRPGETREPPRIEESYKCEFTKTQWLFKPSQPKWESIRTPLVPQGCINLDQIYLSFSSTVFSRITRPRVLHFGSLEDSNKYHHIEAVNTEFLGWLNSLAGTEYVKFLSLQGISGIKQFPPSIGRLTKLVILNLQACHNLEELPVEITKFHHLIYLDVSECYLLKNMPKGMGSLSKLQVLKGFVIGSSHEKAYSCKIQELSRLEKLRKLSIYVKHDLLDSEQELEALKSLTELRILTITWVDGGNSEPKQPGVSIVDIAPPPENDKISFPENLEKLDLRCFPWSTAAEWLSPHKLKNLERLYIRGGALRTFSCDSVDIKWENIKILRLRFLHEFVVPESDLRTQFPLLNYLDIHECPRIARQELGDTSKGS